MIKSYIVLDTETEKEVKDFSDLRNEKLRVCIAHYYKEDIKEKVTFYAPEMFWNYVEDKLSTDKTLLIIAHNIQFDLHILKAYSTLKNKGYKAMGIVLEEQVFLNKWIKENKTLYAFDNMQVDNCSVKRIGEHLGIQKLEVMFNNVSLRQIIERCIIDVEIISYRAPKTFKILNNNIHEKNTRTTFKLEQNIQPTLEWRKKRKEIMPCGTTSTTAKKEYDNCIYPKCFNCNLININTAQQEMSNQKEKCPIYRNLNNGYNDVFICKVDNNKTFCDYDMCWWLK